MYRPLGYRDRAEFSMSLFSPGLVVGRECACPKLDAGPDTDEFSVY